MLIKEILQLKGSEFISLLPETLVSVAAALLAQQSIGAAVVVDAEKGVIGVISERDICRGLGDCGAGIADMPISNLMSLDVVTCGPDWEVSDALEVMLINNFRHLPVIDGDFDVVGIVSMRDMAAVQPDAIE